MWGGGGGRVSLRIYDSEEIDIFFIVACVYLTSNRLWIEV